MSTFASSARGVAFVPGYAQIFLRTNFVSSLFVATSQSFISKFATGVALVACPCYLDRVSVTACVIHNAMPFGVFALIILLRSKLLSFRELVKRTT